VLWLPQENVFTDPNQKGKTQEFPDAVTTKPSVYLSLVVPAYNEEERLPIMLQETLEYLHTRKEKQKDFSYEIILVDDGSRDTTTKKALEYSKDETVDVFRVLTLKKNRGKGGAVKRVKKN
jgi:dolichyl-phosphate beta-glucosyltransferase